jgi:hypothetical protein
MQNNQTIWLLCKGALILALPLVVLPHANAQGTALIPSGAPAQIAVDPNAPKLVYRDPNTPLTVGDLATAQRVKLQEDFFKRAGYTASAPVKVKSNQQGAASVPVPQKVDSLLVLGIYGPVASQRVDVSYNGVQHTLLPKAKLGAVLVESIAPGQVIVSYSGKKVKASKSSKVKGLQLRQTLKAGDMLEIPA